MIYASVIGTIGAIGAILLTIGTGIMLKRVFLTSRKLKAIIHEPSTNDDERAIGSFTTLLEQAHSNMMIYDDGGAMDGSIYMNEEVVKTIKKKLDTEPDFIIQCYFNEDDGSTLFRREFDGHNRVTIQTRPDGDARPDDTHYKIIDGGRMAYLSRHKSGSSQRKFQVIDCTRVVESDFTDMTDSLLGEYKKDIARKFSSQFVS